jgi:hypothetical protein
MFLDFPSEFFCVHTLSLRVEIYVLWFRLRVVLVAIPAMQHTEEADDVLKNLTCVLLAEGPPETRFPNADGVLDQIRARV